MLEGMGDRRGSWLQRHGREAPDLVAIGGVFLLFRRLGISVPVAAGLRSADVVAHGAPHGPRLLIWLSFLIGIATIAFGAVQWILHLLGDRLHAKASGSIARPLNP
jgi:hypothetical protein